MSILFGHTTGMPNVYHGALAHFEAGWLETFFFPWMPSPTTLRLLGCVAPIKPKVDRLARRYFPALAGVPKRQGRVGEMRRLFVRGLGFESDYLAVQANEWLMRTMTRYCANPRVTAVHAYEDCSLWQFRKAKLLGKACVYNMPIGYYAYWGPREDELNKEYADWLPSEGINSGTLVSEEHKREEMELADVVLAPCGFRFRNNSTGLTALLRMRRASSVAGRQFSSSARLIGQDSSAYFLSTFSGLRPCRARDA